jgi:uncharacterized membrane protein
MLVMKAIALVPALAVVALAGMVFAQDPPKEPAKTTKLDFKKDIIPIIKANCISCHNKDKAEHNVMFPDKMTEDDALKNARMWRNSAREVKKGSMPPKNNGTMGDKDRAKLVEWIEAKIPRPARRPGGNTPPPTTPPPTTTGGN